MVDWTAEELSEITGEVLKIAEESDKTASVKLATAAGLPGDLIQRIEADAEFPAVAKRILLKVLPGYTAKQLNAAKISSANKEPGLILGALGYIIFDRMQRRKTLEKLIKEKMNP